MKTRQGSLLIDCLITLLVLVSLLSLINDFLRVQRSKLIFDKLQDEVSLSQLRRSLLLAKDFCLSENNLQFRINDEVKELELVNHKLILRPGVQIFLENIDQISFVNEGNKWYLLYWQNDRSRKVCIYA